VLVLEWLAAAGAIERAEREARSERGSLGGVGRRSPLTASVETDGTKEHPLSFHLDVALDALALLVWRITEIEHISDDEEYKKACERFVRTLLPVGEPGDRFSMPDTYTRFVGGAPQDPPIEFDYVSLY
jgi:hypothetical protein